MRRKLLIKHLSRLGIKATEEQLDQFLTFEDLLVEWNKYMNLTGITESEMIYDKHFADSLTCLFSDIIKESVKVIDVGTGAGFPGVPLKIMVPGMQLTLLDSLNKRINFLKAVGQALDFEDVSYIHGRAEDFGQDYQYREQYDVVVSRAVADLSVLLEYCTPFLKVGGYFIAQKGLKVQEELENATSALEKLSLVVENIIDVKTSNQTAKHTLLVIRKIAHTDEKYPRRAGKPQKKPL